MSLFASRRLIELRIPNSPNRELGEALAALAGGLDESVRFLVTSGLLDRKTVNGAWFKALDPHMLHVAVYPVDRARLAGSSGDAAAQEAAQQRLDSYRVLAGTVPVEGPGVERVVTRTPSAVRRRRGPPC